VINSIKTALSCVLFFFLFFVGTSRSADYYVDSLNGDDANAGTTPATAWKSLERVDAAPLAAGDSVLFRRGRVWRGTLRTKSGEEGRPVRYGAYGKGPKPRILSSADLSDPKLWTRVGDGLWATLENKLRDAKNPAPETAEFASGDWFVYTEDDAEGEASREVFPELDDAEGWRVSCVASGSHGSFFQFTTQGFPVRGARYVALRFRARSSEPFTIPATAPSLFMSDAPWSSYGDTVSSDLEITNEWREFDAVFHTNVDAEDGRVTFFLGGAIPDGATFDFVVEGARELTSASVELGKDVGNLVFTEPGAVKQSEDPETKRFAPTYDRREYCGFKKWTLDALEENGDFWYDIASRRVFLKSDANPGKKYASIEAVLRPHCCEIVGNDVVVENLALTHTGAHGVSVDDAERVVIRDCDFDWIGGGDLYGGGGEGKRVRFGNGVQFWNKSIDCLVERCKFSRVYDTATTAQGPDQSVSRNLTIRDCVIWRCEQAFEIWFSDEETILEGCVFERNLCVDCGRDWSHVQRPDKIATPILGYGLTCAKVDVTIRENVFCDSSEYFIKFWHDRVGEYHIDDNVYWVWKDREHFQGDKYFGFDASHGKPLMTWDEYRAATGQDAHSRWLEPKFRDYDKDDFALLNRDELKAGPSPRRM